MHRFYLKSQLKVGKVLEITDKRVVWQTGKVLRMWKGDKFKLFNDDMEEVVAEIIDINKQKVLVNIVEAVKNNSEPKIEVSLYQAIPKKPALFELVVQKATEIGVSKIYPLITERTERQRMAKFERLQAIAMEATEQSGRLRIPEIHHPVNYIDVIGKLSNGYIAYEFENKKFLSDYGDEVYKGNKVQIVIGPEGGLTEKEVSLAEKSKVKPFTFGPRILRTETAAISALSLVLLEG